MTHPVLYEYQLADGVRAFSTTRHGGVSQGAYTSFNINHYCGDSPEAIAENRRRLCRLLGIAEDHLVYPHQVHHAEILTVEADIVFLPDEERAALLEGRDAVMTDVAGFCVGVSAADCIPVLLYDEAHHAVAAVHAGWRGTLANIVGKTVCAMRETYHTDPSMLRAVIGPGISLRNFEVGDEVYVAFAKAGYDLSLLARRFSVRSVASGDIPLSGTHVSQPKEKWHLDLPGLNATQLIRCGVNGQNILQTGICTYDRVDDFFSARRLGINSGRILTAIMLKSV